MNKTKNIFIILFNLILVINSIAQSNEKPEGTLPVELVYFVGDVVDTTIEIRWGTATEVNNYGYDVKRADTSFVWETIDFVQGHGNSYSPKYYVYYDTTITTNGEYFYLLKQIDFDGNFEMTHDTVKITVDYLTSIKRESITEMVIPSSFELHQNYPNPFNPSTNISFSINERSFISLKLYDIKGEEVALIFNGVVTSGTHSIKFKANNLSSGAYIYKLKVGNKSISKKMLLMK